ncbi:MAG: C4-dicarboxylate ABC transporter substrate-binding protein [Candidatus Mesenet longicola]|uniref:C4-dicarboxylate ABC transporter substrate-binding protein n=1 Tax=Candidatus Mesenet longicola TaxID=1892558 RepID=A0A8J3MNR9_9RICK|nr:MAG: C4-dicarboxylate ABC transporter substrate-binding protein [Candidatus Mesenet longicola]GHM59238.1 MAG: C4-dicarboxylate ABC transporter substrate-binding protein [Candidatus Mesenet longicola]
MRKYIKHFILLFIFIALMCTAHAHAKESKKKFLNIGTGSITGIYYPIGSTICRLLAQDSNKGKIICSVASTTGGAYNINSMRNDDFDIGIAQSDWEYIAYHGSGVSKLKPMHDLRLLFSMHKEYFTLVARKGSNINTVNDIKGGRVNIGAPGTGVRSMMTALMDVNNWTKKDFAVASELKTSEQAQALCDNKIDVMADVIGHPNGTMQEVTYSCDTVFIPIDDKNIERLQEKYPYYKSGIIPGNIYKGNPQSTKTIAVYASLLTKSNLDEDIAYELVKNAMSNLDELKNISGALSNLQKEDMVKENFAPLHDGAKKYYQEIGLLK